MRKFRILKTEKKYNNRTTETYYEIQKKFLFWFFDYGIRVMYSTDHNSNVYRNEPNDIAMLTKRYILFPDIERAKQCLMIIQEPFVEYYKGNLINRVLDDKDLTKVVYVNKSYARTWSAGTGFEYSYTLDGLKEKIDRRKPKISTSIV